MLGSLRRHLTGYEVLDSIEQDRIGLGDLDAEAPLSVPGPSPRLGYSHAMGERTRAAARPGLAAYRQRRRCLRCFKAWQGAALQIARRLGAFRTVKNLKLTGPASDKTGPWLGPGPSSVPP